jgi:peptidyl-tRNA hydrolase
VRIGVQPEHPTEDPIGYLLTPVRRSRRPEMEAILDRAAGAVEAILDVGAARAMTTFNRRDPSAEPS